MEGIMDPEMKQLMDIAAKRGSRYIKGEVMTALESKMAELGVLLLEKARRLPDMDDARKREELIELQNKLDDLRKSIFTSKIKTG
jgi:hypothetical protein